MNLTTHILSIFLFLYLYGGERTTNLLVPPEICDNAIDDDGDGKIDLNDEDCFCPILKPESLIPNPSFEEQDCCPEQHSSVNCATAWLQASEPTPDYYHICGWTANEAFPRPLPDGEGFIGFIDGTVNGDVNPNWKEYVGTCLPQPLLPDSLYRFQFYIGFLDRSISPSMDLVIYGTTECDNIPYGIKDANFGCPTNSLKWLRLGSTSVFGNNEWKQFNFTFKTSQNIQAVIVGPDCYHSTISNNTYYFLDKLELAEDTNFDVNIEVNDQPCSPNLAFEIAYKEGYNYQWYKDGVAIIGATSNVLSKPSKVGKYEVKIVNEKGCKISEPYIHNLPSVFTQITQTFCSGDSLTFDNQQLTVPGFYWDTMKTVKNCDSIIRLELKLANSFEKEITVKIFPSETYKIGNFSFNIPGEYIQTIASENGCDSTIYLKLDHYRIYIPNVFSPNGDGINDVFSIFDGEDLHTISTFQIFDRWGNLIFEEKNMPLNGGWNGKIKNQNAPEAVYIYQSKILMNDAKERSISGIITLLR